MDGKNGLILWILGGAGVLFMYSAYKAKSPKDVLVSVIDGTSTAEPAKPKAGLDAKGSSYEILPDITGNNLLYDDNGMQVGLIPNSYQQYPGTFIPNTQNGTVYV